MILLLGKMVRNSNSILIHNFFSLSSPSPPLPLSPSPGLLFAYGVTNSGKTFTMTGEQDQPGILPRVMDVLFNTIAEVQAPKNVSLFIIIIISKISW